MGMRGIYILGFVRKQPIVQTVDLYPVEDCTATNIELLNVHDGQNSPLMEHLATQAIGLKNRATKPPLLGAESFKEFLIGGDRKASLHTRWIKRDMLVVQATAGHKILNVLPLPYVQQYTEHGSVTLSDNLRQVRRVFGLEQSLEHCLQFFVSVFLEIFLDWRDWIKSNPIPRIKVDWGVLALKVYPGAESLKGRMLIWLRH
jgi:hypothetical protein